MVENEKSIKYAFAALNPFVSTNKVENVEKQQNGKDFILWGTDNRYPEYLYGLYESCATLQAVINGTADFIMGNELEFFKDVVNKKGETIEDILSKVVMDYLIYGGFALQIIKNPFGQVVEIYWIDINKLRSDEKNEVFFYSDDWSKSLGRVKYMVYPKFGQGDDNATSIFYFKNKKSRKTYPTPIYNAAIDSAEIERKISDFHLNEISNNFLTSKIINFNNGTPDDEMKLEIENSINAKFTGSENAGRIMVSFNENKDSETTVTNLGEDGFADRYSALSERVVSQIFTAFRATPNIFGLPTQTTGFNEQEYEGSFKIYNRTAVRPAQKDIVRAFEFIYGQKDILKITPYSIENNDEKTVA